MKIQTHALTGRALDWAVGKVAIKAPTPWLFRGHGGVVSVQEWGHDIRFEPSTRWGHGGLIIENEKIQLTPLNQDNPKYGWAAAYKGRGEYGDDLFSVHRQRGITPLIAAMRCYVSRWLGREVEVPEGLTC